MKTQRFTVLVQSHVILDVPVGHGAQAVRSAQTFMDELLTSGVTPHDDVMTAHLAPLKAEVVVVREIRDDDEDDGFNAPS